MDKKWPDPARVWENYPFPSTFVYKVIARAEVGDLKTRLLAAAATVLGEVDASQAYLGEKWSPQGRYRSLTLCLPVHSVAEVKALYQTLAQQPGVVVVM